ncbi:MAG: hypothetical protein ACFB10_21000 [Salibacteraceae bacterium]
MIVIPKQPYFDWDKAVFPEATPIQEMMEYNSYLLPEVELSFDPQKVMKKDWPWIFENELFSICTDESTWPEKRTWELFNEWFELQFSTLVLDLGHGPIVREKY